jgi:hypothetical protein
LLRRSIATGVGVVRLNAPERRWWVWQIRDLTRIFVTFVSICPAPRACRMGLSPVKRRRLIYRVISMASADLIELAKPHSRHQTA